MIADAVAADLGDRRAVHELRRHAPGALQRQQRARRAAPLQLPGPAQPGAGGAVAAFILMQQELRHDPWPGHFAHRRGGHLATICAWLLPLLVLIDGLLMISNIRYPHMVNRYLRGRRSIGRCSRSWRCCCCSSSRTATSLALGPLFYALVGPMGYGLHALRRMAAAGGDRLSSVAAGRIIAAMSSSHRDRHPLRPFADRLSPRRRARTALFNWLLARTSRREVSPAHRRHRPGPQHRKRRGNSSKICKWLGLALGQRRAGLSIQARRSTTGSSRQLIAEGRRTRRTRRPRSWTPSAQAEKQKRALPLPPAAAHR